MPFTLQLILSLAGRFTFTWISTNHWLNYDGNLKMVIQRL